MAKFAQYFIQFNQEGGSYDWEKRQEHLGELLAEDDSIKFEEGEVRNIESINTGCITFRPRLTSLSCGWLTTKICRMKKISMR